MQEKNLKKQQLKSKQKYKMFFENSYIGIVYFDTNGIIINANKKASNIFQIEKNEIRGFNLLQNAQNKDLLRVIEKSIKLGTAVYKGYHETTYLKRKIYIEIYFQAIKDKNGNILYVIASIFDKTVEHKAVEKLIDDRIKWDSFVNTMINLFVQTDKNAIIKQVSPSIYDILGYTQKEVIGKNIFSFWQNKDDALKHRKSYIKNLIPIKSVEYPFLHKNGSTVMLDFNVTPIIDKDEKLAGSISIAKDMTEFNKTQSTLKLYKDIIEQISDGVTITDKYNKIIDVNQAFCDITQYSKDEAMGNDPKILNSGVHNAEFYKNMWENIDKKGSWSGEIWNKHKDNGIYPEFITINVIKDKDNNIQNYVAIFHDISMIKENEAKMQHLATHDLLTSLPNRVMLSTTLKNAIDDAKRLGNKIAILFLDLDNFKTINDTKGHNEGDKILISAASRLQTILRKNDKVFRFGGDEFIIISKLIKDTKDIANIAEKISTSIQKPFKTKKNTYNISCSIGISVYPDDGHSSTELIKKADMAMYEAKNNGKSKYNFYSKDIGLKVEKEIQIENLLQKAIRTNQFEVYYQPKISLSDGKVVGMEALMRWNNPQIGMVSPNIFIPVAEKTGLIAPLGKWILQTACKQIKIWQDMNLYQGTISVNVSGAQLNSQNIFKTIQDTLLKSNLDAKYLNLELTESTLMDNKNNWKIFFKRCKELGSTISIDDFGTGYSSLAYLTKLPIDELKIDKSFIDDIPYKPDACTIIKTIITLSKNLGFKTVAEGVETKEQNDYLKDNGCDIIQGYFYSKPLPANKIEKFLINFKY